MSHCLSRRDIDHVVLERHEVASAWVRQRWDSLRLLTPNWMTRLPGVDPFDGPADGFAPASDVAVHLRNYASTIGAPVVSGCAVERDRTGRLRMAGVDVRRSDPCSSRRPRDRAGHDTADPGGRGRAVGIAANDRCTGVQEPRTTSRTAECWWSERPRPGRRSPMSSRGPAAASCLQSASTSGRCGRTVVTISTGGSTAPDLLDERYDTVDDVRRVRATPSFQLVGSDDGRSVDLDALQSRGVRLAGRLVGSERSGRSSPGRSPTSARLPISSWSVCSHSSITSRPNAASTTSTDPWRPERTERSRTAPRAPTARAAHRDLGDRARPDISRHRRASVRPTRATPARRWRRGHDRVVRARACPFLRRRRSSLHRWCRW